MSNNNHKLGDVISDWESGGLPGEITAHVTTNGDAGQTMPPPRWLHPDTVAGMSRMGIASPYAHQVEAWNLLHGGGDAVVATPTASGKTLCYNVPVADAIAKDPAARALYLFPTKALARDQEATVRKLLALTGLEAKAVVYDGDTPTSIRRAARRDANIIITNPDMLHTGILPHHPDWAHFFSGLSHVVVDELHHYRGVFGSHVANVLRRLQRVTDFYGARPRFTACSATIGNPGELARNILGREATVISRSGAPVGKRDFLLYNPPVVDPVMGTRASALKTAARLAADLVRDDVATLVFCQTRRGVEIVLRYLRDRMEKSGKDPERVRGYRGGYLPHLRREIETDLREGNLDAVVATNALELGIDVGGLDAVVLAGYPGTIAATHQRGGRAGRRQEPALCVMIARSTPLDQFLAREPGFLLDASPEQALVQPDNIEILLAHLKCAAFELPFRHGEAFGTVVPADAEAALSFLVEEGDLRATDKGFHYVASAYPAAAVNLRTAAGNNVVVYNSETNEPLAQVPPHSARFELHEQAIYQHDGETYEVERFDAESDKAFVRPVPPVYYTTAVDQTKINVIASRENATLPFTTLHLGDIEVIEHMAGFKKIKFRTHENLGYGDIQMPPLEMETEAAWLEVGGELTGNFDSESASIALEGLSNTLAQVASLRLMCDPRDIAVKVQASHDQEEGTAWRPLVFVYDAHEGGVGLAARAYEDMPVLLKDCLTLLNGCPCDTGCPACTGPIANERVNAKKVAATVAALLCGGEADSH